MRYLVFGDVHGNIDALDAVLAEAGWRGVDGYLFVGDVVGYGPSPLECIERLMDLQQRGLLAWVAGNHELAVRGAVEWEGYNEEAVRTLEWTRAQLATAPAAHEFLAAGKLTAQVNDTIWLTHDSLAESGGGGYHRLPQNAKRELAWLAQRGGRVCFYGHTHTLRAELRRGAAEIVLVPMTPQANGDVDPHPLQLTPRDAGWIGVGSVGFPKNEARWPEFVILDDVDGDDWKVEKYVVKYARARAKERVRATLTAPCGEDVANRIAKWL
jgi:predicted phosphodiesterase